MAVCFFRRWALVVFSFFLLSTAGYSSPEIRDINSELSPQIYTYLVSDFYSILRKYKQRRYENYIKPIFIELDCDINQPNIDAFNNILIRSVSAVEFANNVFKNFTCD